MDLDSLSAFTSLPLRRRDELVEALSDTFVRLSNEGIMTVKAVRDQFSSINRLAKAGQAQVIGRSPQDQTVILSVQELASIIQAAASSMTFGVALDVAGFVPVAADLRVADAFERETGLVMDEVEETLDG
jgi:hypothetical protein